RYAESASKSELADTSSMVRINARQSSGVYPELRVIWSVGWHAVQTVSTSSFPSPVGNGADWRCWASTLTPMASTTMKNNAPAHDGIDHVAIAPLPADL